MTNPTRRPEPSPRPSRGAATAGLRRTPPSGALEAEAAFARLLADASFADIVTMAPALFLQALPMATGAKLLVMGPGQGLPVTSSAGRCAAAAPPADIRVLTLRICLEDRADAGVLRLHTRSANGFRGAAAVTAAILTSQLEAALDRAVARVRSAGPRSAATNNLDLGVALGLVMASQQLDRDGAFELLNGISTQAGLDLVDVVAHVIQIGESGATGRQLRLVDPLDAR